MQQTITGQLEELVRLRHASPQEVIAEAVEIGMLRLYTDSVLKQYLDKHISRNKAIQLAGIEAVRLAEQQHKITREDIAWGLKNG